MDGADALNTTPAMPTVTEAVVSARASPQDKVHPRSNSSKDKSEKKEKHKHKHKHKHRSRDRHRDHVADPAQFDAAQMGQPEQDLQQLVAVVSPQQWRRPHNEVGDSPESGEIRGEGDPDPDVPESAAALATSKISQGLLTDTLPTTDRGTEAPAVATAGRRSQGGLARCNGSIAEPSSAGPAGSKASLPPKGGNSGPSQHELPLATAHSRKRERDGAVIDDAANMESAKEPAKEARRQQDSSCTHEGHGGLLHNGRGEHKCTSREPTPTGRVHSSSHDQYTAAADDVAVTTAMAKDGEGKPPRHKDATSGREPAARAADDRWNRLKAHESRERHRSSKEGDRSPAAHSSRLPPSSREAVGERAEAAERDHSNGSKAGEQEFGSKAGGSRGVSRDQSGRDASREPSARCARAAGGSRDRESAKDRDSSRGASRDMGEIADRDSSRDRGGMSGRDRDRGSGKQGGTVGAVGAGQNSSRVTAAVRRRSRSRSPRRAERDPRFAADANRRGGSKADDADRGRDRDRHRSDRTGDRGVDWQRHGGGWDDQAGGRDDRDGRRGKAGERAQRSVHKREPSPELDAAAAAALAKFTGGDDSEDEEVKLIEERRKRLAAIKAKHQQAESIIAPTASSLSLMSAHPSASRLMSEPASGHGTPSIAAGSGLHKASLNTFGHNAGHSNIDTDAVEQGTPGQGGGDASGSGSDGDEEDAAPDGPVFDVFDAGAAEAAAVASAASAQRRLSVGVAAAAAAAADAAADAADDMFANVDVDANDMFEAGAGGGGLDEADDRAEAARAARRPGGAALADAYDDPEGYYNFQVGEIMDGRYEVFEFKGKGVFSSVLRARDNSRRIAGSSGDEAACEVAVKMIRANETMSKAALTEQAILRRLAAADPENKKNCIRLIRTFDYRHHTCLVFEPMDMNLRDLTKKYGRNVGLNLTAVSMFTAQMLVALRHLKKQSVLHADIKPDNILVNARRNKVKLCDFGSAMLAGDAEVTPYLVSRFYRAPEVILGLKYDYAMDMWSVGTVVYELFTGKILFPGRSNNEMLRLMMDVKGPFSKKMLRKGQFSGKHFEDDPNMSFVQLEEDPVTKKPIRRLIANPVVKASVATLLSRASGKHGAGTTATAERMQLSHLVDLLDKMLVLEPEKRIDPETALRHPFVRDHVPTKAQRRGRKLA